MSIEYRLAPEHFLPAAYEDCWTALQWIASGDNNKEPWLSNHGDFDRLFIGGDSAGANIVHKIAMQACIERLPTPSGVKISVAFLTHPYFWGSKAIGKEPIVEREKTLCYLVCDFVNPSAVGGIDSPLINPVAPGTPSLANLGCSKLLATVASMDVLRDRGVCFYEAVKKSGWKGEAELFEVEGEDHAFHILNPQSEKADHLFKRLASFLLN